MALCDDLLDDARHLALKGSTESRDSCMRRAISTAYYAVFHMIVNDFVEHWPFADQRARLGRMFTHQRMRDTAVKFKDPKSPTSAETDLKDIVQAFGQLQKDRHRADYDPSWKIVDTDVQDAITSAADIIKRWRAIQNEEAVQTHVLSMFGAKTEN
jgi:uncharacterized protein (UPF0332 family)